MKGLLNNFMRVGDNVFELFSYGCFFDELGALSCNHFSLLEHQLHSKVFLDDIDWCHTPFLQLLLSQKRSVWRSETIL